MKLLHYSLSILLSSLLGVQASTNATSARIDFVISPGDTVTGKPDLTVEIAVRTDLRDLDSLSLVSKGLFKAVDASLIQIYSIGGHVLWKPLLLDIKKITPEQRRPLLRFLLQHLHNR